MWLFDSLLSLATEGHRKKCKQRVKLFAAHRSAFRKYVCRPLGAGAAPGFVWIVSLHFLSNIHVSGPISFS